MDSGGTKTRKTLRAQRKAARTKALEAITAMTDEDLRNMSCELGREMNVKANVVNEVRVRLDAVRGEIERRRTITSGGICVSDHAVLRYLERHKGLDTKSIREEIIAMAVKSGKVNSGEQYARPTDKDNGIAFGFNGITNVVTTVFPKDQFHIIDIK